MGASGSASTSMNSFMIGSFLFNFVISFSMKKLLEAIRVLQLIAFMVWLKINFSPISLFVMNQMYKFVTFKVVPPEVMDLMLYKLGLKKMGGVSNDQQAQQTLRVLQETQDQGNEEETGAKAADFDLLSSMNIMLVGGMGAMVFFIIAVVTYYLMVKNHPIFVKKMKNKLTALSFNGIH